jgi:hypothetical protein
MMTSEVLFSESVLDEMNGKFQGRRYVTTTITLFPGLLQGLNDGVQLAPESGQVVTAVKSADLIPGYARPLT